MAETELVHYLWHENDGYRDRFMWEVLTFDADGEETHVAGGIEDTQIEAAAAIRDAMGREARPATA